MYTLDNVLKKLSRHRDKKIILTSGVFDLVHIGHIQFINKCKKLGDILVVAIPCDKSVVGVKGEHRPIISEEQRAEIVSSFKDVNYVYITHTHPYTLDILNKIKPSTIVFGNKETMKKFYKVVNKDDLKNVLPKTTIKHLSSGLENKISTSKIEKKIYNRKNR